MGHKIGTILRALRTLQEEAMQGNVSWPQYGVCKNLDSVLDRSGGYAGVYSFVDRYSWDWPHAIHSQDVPNPDSLCPYFVPHVSGTALWEGANLDIRLDLIDFLIEKCEAVLAS